MRLAKRERISTLEMRWDLDAAEVKAALSQYVRERRTAEAEEGLGPDSDVSLHFRPNGGVQIVALTDYEEIGKDYLPID